MEAAAAEFLRVSVNENYENKDVEITFLDGDENLQSESSDALTDNIYHIDLVLVLYPFGRIAVVQDRCDEILQGASDIMSLVNVRDCQCF